MPNETTPIFTINRPNLSREDQRIAGRFAARFDQLSRNQKYAILAILERGILKHHYAFELIPQPSPVTCTAACIATVLGRDIDLVIQDFHDDFHKGRITIASYMRQFFPDAESRLSGDRDISKNGVYFLGVPSLNKPKGMHSVVLDTRFGDQKLFDPLAYADKNHYSADNPVHAFVIDCFIPWDLLRNGD